MITGILASTVLACMIFFLIIWAIYRVIKWVFFSRLGSGGTRRGSGDGWFDGFGDGDGGGDSGGGD